MVFAEQFASSGAPSMLPSGSLNLSVEQMNGCSCGPEKMGPVMGWLIRVRCAAGALPAVKHPRRFSPIFNPLTKPIQACSGASARNDGVTSVAVQLDDGLRERQDFRHIDAKQHIAAADLVRPIGETGDLKCRARGRRAVGDCRAGEQSGIETRKESEPDHARNYIARYHAR